MMIEVAALVRRAAPNWSATLAAMIAIDNPNAMGTHWKLAGLGLGNMPTPNPTAATMPFKSTPPKNMASTREPLG